MSERKKVGGNCLLAVNGDTPVWRCLTVAVVVDSEAFHIAKSSARRALEMCREKLVVLS